MILSAGLSPAWQQILRFQSFQVGEVNRASDAVWCASGKVLNAGIAVHHLGGPSLTLSPLGGVAWSPVTTEFESLGVPYHWVPTATSTRVCTTILDQARSTMTELVENGRPLSEAELNRFRTVYIERVRTADIAIVIGSLPQGTPESYYRELLEQTSCPTVLDFRGSGLLSVLDLEPEFVKPNREELASTVGHRLTTDEEVLAAMRSLNDRGARWVVVTQGPGPVWVTSANEAYRLHAPPVADIVNPIGSGDAMAATLAWALRSGSSAIESVRMGIAAAQQNMCQLLPCRLDASRLEHESSTISVERID